MVACADEFLEIVSTTAGRKEDAVGSRFFVGLWQMEFHAIRCS